MPHEKAARFISLRDWIKPAEEPDGEIMIGIDVDFRTSGKRHLDSGINQKRAEDIEHPVKAGDDAHSHENEERAHRDRPDDAPEQHAVLITRRDLEIGKNEDEH